MKPLLFFLFLFLNSLCPVLSQSNLLETVKKNPNEAMNLCNKFRDFNSKGISASSDKVIEYVSNKKKLTPVNAEIFSIYVIGLHLRNWAALPRHYLKPKCLVQDGLISL